MDASRAGIDDRGGAPARGVELAARSRGAPGRSRPPRGPLRPGRRRTTRHDDEDQRRQDRLAVRLTALLIADATPAFAHGTDDISVEVSGRRPGSARTRTGARTAGRPRAPTRAAEGGRIGRASCHGSTTPGSGEPHQPAAMRIGLRTTRNGRAPYRPARAPTRVESSVRAGSLRQACHAVRRGPSIPARPAGTGPEGEGSCTGRVVEQRRQVDRRECPAPEQGEGNQGVRAAGHQHRERRRRDQAHRQRRPGEGVLPATVLAADHAERDAAHGGDRHGRPQPVEPPAGALGRVSDVRAVGHSATTTSGP